MKPIAPLRYSFHLVHWQIGTSPYIHFCYKNDFFVIDLYTAWKRDVINVISVAESWIHLLEKDQISCLSKYCREASTHDACCSGALARGVLLYILAFKIVNE
jgi:hypothetical protein